MVTGLSNTIPYYVYSPLQQLQDLYDELAALRECKVNAEIQGATREYTYEFDIAIEMTLAAIGELKSMAN